VFKENIGRLHSYLFGFSNTVSPAFLTKIAAAPEYLFYQFLNRAIQYSEVLFNPIIHLDISQLNIQME